jgi:hypothetical protein
VTLLLTILGILVLLPSVAGLVFGGFIALDPKTRGQGVMFALWWVSGVVAALGILVRDSATFVMGLFCFTVAGLALIVGARHPRKPAFKHEAWHAEKEDMQDEELQQEGEPEKEAPEHPQTPLPNDHPETSIIAGDDEMASNEPEEDEPREKQ